MTGHERLRLFCALKFPAETLERLAAWQAGLAFSRGGRAVSRENLHVTLAFLGATPRERMEDVARALREAAHGLGPPALAVTRYRETRSVGMLVLEDAGGRATELAARLSSRLEASGLYRPERRPWLPHVTVVRFRERPRLDPPLPDLGRFVPSEATVTMSVLRPTGAQYADIESVALGG
ncbi:MAG TPA: RNA 2',3'-cyclic phosphodiesterase [Gaiellaceae bacterium]|nr:RNA 2',3'-cyclic phosphodiesterase [Gaiellaceae bacterium]